jgi:hypothetical protein
MGQGGSQIGQRMPGDLQVLQGKVWVLPYLLSPVFATVAVSRKSNGGGDQIRLLGVPL